MSSTTNARPAPHGHGGTLRSDGDLLCTAFGTLAVHCDGRPTDIGGPKQRLLLTLMLSRANRGTRVDALLDALWDAAPPRTARKNLQVYQYKLRKVFGSRISLVGSSYHLAIDPRSFDIGWFEQLVRDGRHARQAGNVDTAVRLFDSALESWGGEPFSEFAAHPLICPEIERLVELHLATLEDWAELALGTGDARSVAERLRGSAPLHPLRERMAAAWMRALAATGRANDALQFYETVRRTLADELGIDPGRIISDTHVALVRGEFEGTALPFPARAVGSDAYRPGNPLPRDLSDFVGRSDEIERLVDHLTASPRPAVAVLSGPVGAGKTALAVHVGHRVRHRFPDGIILLDMAGPDGAAKGVGELLPEALAGVGLASDPGLTAQAEARWRSWIGERKVLLVIENAASAAAVRTLLPGSGPAAALVTSRSRLSGLESVLRVPLGRLSRPEAWDLFVRNVGRKRCHEDAESVNRILGHCAGLPLAVRAATEKLASLRHLSPRGLADRLDRTESLIDELSAGELSVRSRFDLLARHLRPVLREACTRLAAMGPVIAEPDVVAALGEIGHDGSVDALVDALVEAHLILPSSAESSGDRPAFRLPPLARTYWAECPGRPVARDLVSRAV